LVFQDSLQLTDFKRCALLADIAKAKLRRGGISIGDLGVRGTWNSQLRFLKGKNDRVVEPAKRYRKATIYPKQMRHKAIFQLLSIQYNKSEIIRICFLVALAVD
jgi:hypothetical protein